MKQILLAMVLLVCGCRQSIAPLPPTIDEATGLNLAYDVCLIVESLDGRPVGCATLLTADEQSFVVAAPLELVNVGCKIVEWRGELKGQKFERAVFTDFEPLGKEAKLKLAVLKVAGLTSKQALPFANTERPEFTAGFAAYGARVSQPRPLEAVTVKVVGLTVARAAEDQPSSKFFQVDGILDFKMLGSPLVTQQGELAAVAIGNFWNSTLYCPVDRLRELISGR